jgi:hypothetical protein
VASVGNGVGDGEGGVVKRGSVRAGDGETRIREGGVGKTETEGEARRDVLNIEPPKTGESRELTC